MFDFAILHRELQFKETAWTSRGKYNIHDVWYVVIWDEVSGDYGIGECAPLVDLSPEFQSRESYEALLSESLKTYCQKGFVSPADCQFASSIFFGIETADMQIKNHGSTILYDTSFTRKCEGITINGLVWMGPIDVMRERAFEKYKAGFRCLKFKIGGEDFDKELSLLKEMRKSLSDDMVIRCDANCAYSLDMAENVVLPALRDLGVHSVEQPLKTTDIEGLSRLSDLNIVSIALDESLIKCRDTESRRNLVETVRPQYLILKPSLCGGIAGAEEWISIAKEYNVGYWVTSALESQLGLRRIAEWTSTLGIDIPQGLGTGQIYENEMSFFTCIRNDRLFISDNDSMSDFSILLLEKIKKLRLSGHSCVYEF